MSWISNLFRKREKPPERVPNPWTTWSDRWDALDSLTSVQRAAIAATIDYFDVSKQVAFFGDVGLDNVRSKVLRPLSLFFGSDPRLEVKSVKRMSPEENRMLQRLSAAILAMYPRQDKGGFVMRRRGRPRDVLPFRTEKDQFNGTK